MNQLPAEKKSREVLDLKHEDTNPEWGEKPEDRNGVQALNYGLVSVDKPSGPSSHQVSERVKEKLGVKKAGHSGTLDPKVTGVLPIGLNQATRALRYLLKAGKEYDAWMKVHEPVEEEKIREVLKGMVGVIKQKPPVKSAVKRVVRQRRIYYLEVKEVKDQFVRFVVGCEAGTYVRKLCHDAGVKMGVRAHMTKLRRTKVGLLREQGSVGLEDLSESSVQPVEHALEFMPKAWVSDLAVRSVCNGVTLWPPGVSKINKGVRVGEDVMLLTLKGELIGFGELLVKPERVSETSKGVVKPHSVIMKKCAYPKS